jgi:hypothetical protein
MELVARFFPHTLSEWEIQVAVSLVASYLLISLSEYIFHRFFMHQGMPAWVYKSFPFLETLLVHHRKLHHQVYYHQFDFEPDEYGKDVNLRFGPEHTFVGVLLFAPLFVVIAFTVSAVPGLVFLLCAGFHTVVWNTIHVEMHQPKHPFWTKWELYKVLGRNHYLHHRNTRTGFNVVMPFFDVFLETAPVLTEADREEIEKLGFT